MSVAMDLRDEDAPEIVRPVTYGDCLARDLGTPEEPCPYVGCSMHLYLEVHDVTGEISIAHPELEPDELPATCALRVADEGAVTLDALGTIFNVTRERVRQIEVKALHLLRRHGRVARMADDVEREGRRIRTAPLPVAVPAPTPAAPPAPVLIPADVLLLARRTDRFRCEPYRTALSAGTCVARQDSLAAPRVLGQVRNDTVKCQGCPVGAAVRAAVADDPAPERPPAAPVQRFRRRGRPRKQTTPATGKEAAVAASKRPDPETFRHRLLAAQQNADLASRMESLAPDTPDAFDRVRDFAGTPVPDDGGVVITRELVTPAMAQAWLENMGANRPVSDVRVKQYAADIRANRWPLSHQGFAFDREGRMRDGQHRAWALVESGVAIWAHVARGLSEEACETIDQNRARTAADALRIGGMRHEARAVSWFRVVESVRAKKPVMVSQARVRALLDLYAPTVAWMLAHAPKSRPLNRAPVLAAVLFAHAAAPTETAAFVEGYATGAGLEPGSPILALRKYVLETVPHVRESEPKVFAKALRALYAHVEGEPIHELKESQAAWSWFEARQPKEVSK